MDWNLESKYHWQGIRNLLPEFRNQQRGIQNQDCLRLSHITLGEKVCISLFQHIKGWGASQKPENRRRFFVTLPTTFISYFILEDTEAVFRARETARWMFQSTVRFPRRDWLTPPGSPRMTIFQLFRLPKWNCLHKSMISLLSFLRLIIESLSNDYGNKNDKKSYRFGLVKQQPCTRITLFSVHWKLPKCTFYKGRECKKRL